MEASGLGRPGAGLTVQRRNVLADRDRSQLVLNTCHGLPSIASVCSSATGLKFNELDMRNMVNEKLVRHWTSAGFMEARPTP